MKRVTLAQNSEADKKQAMMEVEVLSSLRHPHIVPYKECYWVCQPHPPIPTVLITPSHSVYREHSVAAHWCIRSLISSTCHVYPVMIVNAHFDAGRVCSG